MINLENIKGAIFDLDGTLLDSMWKWQTMEAEYLKKFGIEPKPNIADILMPLNQQEVSEYLKSKYGIDKTIEVMSKEQNALMEEFYFNDAGLKSGVVSLLEMLHLKGIKMCVATATERYLVEPTLVRLNISKYFGKTFTCPDEKTTKTKPDIYIRAAQSLGTNIGQTIVFEDAFHAIKTAKAAGFIVAAVYDKSAEKHKEEIKQLADYYIESIDALL